MAVTGEIYNHLIFGGVDSADYGIYITGEAVYNAPSRAVDMITVPGRNGDVALDQGRFENIVVTYPAGTFGDDQNDFRTALSDFRNAILAQRGYQRLEDTYHPDEYRMGIYVEPFEVKPVNHGVAGQFTLSFNCKPQRYLTSGEESRVYQSGHEIENPTFFDAQPLIRVLGTGTINIGTQSIEILPVPIGEILLFPQRSYVDQTGQIIAGYNESRPSTLLNRGDFITVKKTTFTIQLNQQAYRIELLNESGVDAFHDNIGGNQITLSFPELQMSYAMTYSPTIPQQHDYTATVRIFEDVNTYYDCSLSLTLANRIHDGVQVLTFGSLTFPSGCPYSRKGWSTIIGEATAVSSVLVSDGRMINIDCESGEAYTTISDELVSLNNVVSMGGDLPVLKAGETQITYDDSITYLSITPRWWKI